MQSAAVSHTQGMLPYGRRVPSLGRRTMELTVPAASVSSTNNHAPRPLQKQARKQLCNKIKQHRKQLCSAVAVERAPHELLSELLVDLRRMELWESVRDPAQPSACQMVKCIPTTPATTAKILTLTGKAMPAQLPDLDQFDLDSEEFAPRSYETAGRVLVCQGKKCQAKGALGVLQAVSAVSGGSDSVQVLPCKCLGKCKEGAAIRIKREGEAKCSTYTHLSPHDIPAIMDSHFAAPEAMQSSSPSTPASNGSLHQGSNTSCSECTSGL